VNNVPKQPFARNILCCQYDYNAGVRLRDGDVNLLHQGTRMFCPQHGAVEHARNLHVVNELASAK
jgi:hypothetical protein